MTASVSTHVPKPHTPFQWAAMDSEAETRRKQGLLADRARALRVNLKMHENQQSHIEGIFSRGDRRAGELLEAAFRLGCRFDSWDDALRIDLWEQAVAETSPRTGFDIARPLGTLPVTARLPWSHIDIGLEPDFLAKEYRKALKDCLSPPCGKPYKKLLHPSSVAAAEAGAKDKLICYDCGIACDLDAMKGERLFYLRRMNAWGGAPALTEDPQGVPNPSRDESRRAKLAGIATRLKPSIVPRKPRPPQDPTRPPPRSLQGKPHGYRVRYTKLGRVVYLGHLDLVRHLPRIFRRAGLEIYYSVGFHPKPELSFGPALGLGIPSLGEILDVKLVDDLPPDEVVRRLSRVSLDGIDILEVARVLDNDRALGRVITESETIAQLPVGADLAAALWRGSPATSRSESCVNRTRRSPARSTCARRCGRSRCSRTPEARRRLGWADGPMISFAVSVSNEGSAKPIEVVSTLFGDRDRPEDRFGAAGALGRRADRSAARQRAPPAHVVVARPTAAAAAP